MTFLGEKIGKFVSPGSLCDQKQQLCIGGSICDHDRGICECAAGHKISASDTCFTLNSTEKASLGEDCNEDVNCEAGALCREKRCSCSVDTNSESGYCSRLVERKHFSSMKFVPQLIQPAQRCPMKEQMSASCVLPDCFCSRSGREPPSGIPIDQLPQIVVLTFDDPVNDKSMRDYRRIFEQINPLNPNGCPIRGTFFVSHEWTNYNQVEWLAANGHELASNSISHRILTGLNFTDWLMEMDGQRQVMARFGNVDESQIIGMRSAQLGLGGDVQFLMAKQTGFLYDNSISVDSGIDGEPYWPQTLDFSVPYKCENEYCPRASIPGLWAIPMNVFHGATELLRSPMLQGILTGSESAEEVLYYLYRNFHRAYSKNRAPYVVNLSSDFLQAYEGIGIQALENFINLVRQNEDVYFMTMRELVDWLRSPKTIQELNVKTNNCYKYLYSAVPQQQPCLQPNRCMYYTPNLGSKEHQFMTCNRCPLLYPWIQNPMGNL